MADNLFISDDPITQGQLAAAQANLASVRSADATRAAQNEIALDAYQRSQTPSWSAPQSPLATAGAAPTPATGSMPTPATPGAMPPTQPSGGAPAGPGSPDAMDATSELGYADRLAASSASPAAAPMSDPGFNVTGGTPMSSGATAPTLPTQAAAPPYDPDAGSAASYGPAAATASRRAYIAGLANVPGGGSVAAQMHWADLDAQMKVMHNVFDMAQHDPEAALNYAEQGGMPVPPQLHAMLGNRAAVAQMKAVMDNAKALYPNDVDAPARYNYVQGALKGLSQQPGSPVAGNPNAAINGPAPTSKPFFEPQPTMVTGQSPGPGMIGASHIGVFDPNKALTDPAGAVTDTGVSGMPRGYGAAARGLFGGTSIQDQLYRAWLSQPGHESDIQGARDFAMGKGQMNPQQMVGVAHTMADADVRAKYNNSPSPPPPDRMQAEIAGLQNQYLAQLQQAGTAAALAPQPSAPQAQPQASGQAAPPTSSGAGSPAAPVPVPRGADGRPDVTQLRNDGVTTYQTARGPARYIGNGQFQTVQ